MYLTEPETDMHTRRNLLLGTGAVALTSAAAYLALNSESEAAEGTFEVELAPAEWRDRLTEEEYAVLREEATEAPFSSPLNEEQRAGIFTCGGCGQDVYSSETKFMSGTGWPSFWDNLEGAVGTKTDYKLIYPRTEVHCSRCGGHLGHIFEDGPEPTGLRHCLNGVALDFRAEAV
jgi:peptide-methionine (R)-S-oxide reductase